MAFGFLLFPDPARQLFPQRLKIQVSPDPVNSWGLKNRVFKFEKKHLNVMRGNSESFLFQCFMADNPFSLVDHTITFYARPRSDESQIYLQKEVDPMMVGTDLANGVFVIPFEIAETMNFPVVMNYEIIAVHNISGTVTLCQGEVKTYTSGSGYPNP